MKELIAISTNEFVSMQIGPGEQELRSMVEIALVVSEPEYSVDAGGLRKDRSTETIRIGCSTTMLRKLAEAFTETADECDAHFDALLHGNYATPPNT